MSKMHRTLQLSSSSSFPHLLLLYAHLDGPNISHFVHGNERERERMRWTFRAKEKESLRENNTRKRRGRNVKYKGLNVFSFPSIYILKGQLFCSFSFAKDNLFCLPLTVNFTFPLLILSFQISLFFFSLCFCEYNIFRKERK